MSFFKVRLVSTQLSFIQHLANKLVSLTFCQTSMCSLRKTALFTRLLCPSRWLCVVEFGIQGYSKILQLTSHLYSLFILPMFLISLGPLNISENVFFFPESPYNQVRAPCTLYTAILINNCWWNNWNCKMFF